MFVYIFTGCLSWYKDKPETRDTYEELKAAKRYHKRYGKVPIAVTSLLGTSNYFPLPVVMNHVSKYLFVYVALISYPL